MTRACAAGHLLGQFDILVGHGRNANRTAGATGDFFRIALENGPGATADGADADKANIDGFHGLCLLCLVSVVTFAIVFEETGNAADRLAQVILVRQEDQTEVIRMPAS